MADITDPNKGLYPKDITHYGSYLIDDMTVEQLRFAVRQLKASNNALTGANLYQASLMDRFMQDIPASEVRNFNAPS
jgi:hypothetical protein